MIHNEIFFKDKTILENNLNGIIKRRIGNGVFVSQKQTVDKNRKNLILGICIPQFIDDSKTEKRIVKFLKFDSIGILEIAKETEGFQIILPSIKEVSERLSNKMSRLLFNVQATLLQTNYRKLVEIPSVQNSLTPIRDILIDLNKNHEVNIETLTKYRGEAKTKRYIQFLESLGIVRLDREKYISGNEFTHLQEMGLKDNDNLYNLLLAHVLKNGWDYMKEYLKLTAITPYIRLSTSYYIPSSENNSLLSLTQPALLHYYSNIYGVKPIERQATTQINHMVEVDIFREEDKYLRGTEDILTNVEVALAKVV